ncbi:MAG: DnaD domain protein [Firmicutes bacterium]|jgi:DnaD/phage-associated family protein|nr:DnaD domain protein [Bacillota bacterium]
MNFKRQQKSDYYLFDTDVENIFINEYMASAPGDFVKVYLFALMYAGLDEEMNNEIIARQLGLSEEDVLKAWSYWEGLGVIRKNREKPEDKFNYQVEFINLKELLYGKGIKKKKVRPDGKARADMSDKTIQSMYQSIERIAGRTISSTEMMKILSWINDFNASPEIIVYAYSYCKGKEKQDIRYIAAVVKSWVAEGLSDVLAVEEYLQNTDQRHYLYRRVCKALGFARNATEEEMKIMDRWFDDMNYTIDKVLEACGKTSGISNPNMNYVNKILTNWHQEKTGDTGGGQSKSVPAAVIQKYYSYLRSRAENEAEERKREVYGKVPAIKEVEEQMKVCGMEISKLIISDRLDKEQQVKRLQNKIDDLTREKAVLLTDHDFELDYMDMHYQCGLCKDTGTNDDGGRCECYNLRTKEAELWQKKIAKS